MPVDFTPRFIVRPPRIRTTPRLLKEALGASRTLRWPSPSTAQHKPSYTKDFFLTYPPIEELEEYADNVRWSGQYTAPSELGGYSERRDLHQSNRNQILESYSLARAFASSSKPVQRRALHDAGFPVPRTAYTRNTGGTQSMSNAGGPGNLQSGRISFHNSPTTEPPLGLESSQPNVEPEQASAILQSTWFGRSGPHLRGSGTNEIPCATYITRPLRHSQGRGYTLDSDAEHYEEGREYIQEVYPKNHEYRIISVRGEPLITLIKRRPEHLTAEQPWNHANGSYFVTVSDPSNNRLRHTNIYDLIRSSTLLKAIDLAGIDILYADRENYVVCEINLCPAITIESNLQRIKEHVHSSSCPARL